MGWSQEGRSQERWSQEGRSQERWSQKGRGSDGEESERVESGGEESDGEESYAHHAQIYRHNAHTQTQAHILVYFVGILSLEGTAKTGHAAAVTVPCYPFVPMA